MGAGVDVDEEREADTEESDDDGRIEDVGASEVSIACRLSDEISEL